jgi:ribosomal protein S18 acetylase RimI-like enzyme
MVTSLAHGSRGPESGYDLGVFELTEIDASNWRRALAVEVRPDQVRFVADCQPVALVILSKCYVRPAGQTWTPYLALYDDEPVGVVAVVSEGDVAQLRHFAIDHRRQGEGLGRMLVDAAVAAVSSTQPMCRSVIVTAHPENEIALSLYRSAGFRPTGAVSGIEPVLALDLTE